MLGVLKLYHNTLPWPTIERSSVVSPLFPGQFNYCLDEIHIYEKYGDFVNIYDDEHFLKIQPSIRLADFQHYFSSKDKSPHHLGLFTMTTINGGHIMARSEAEGLYRNSVFGVMKFLTDYVGLKKERLLVSYCAGHVVARQVEAGAKKSGSHLKIEADFEIPADPWYKYWLEAGLTADQMQPDHSRDTFLTSNWDVTVAPWGYRNEILYKLDNGSYLDIATIECLLWFPVVVNRDGINYVTDVRSWDRCLVVDGAGLERLLLASDQVESVFKMLGFDTVMAEGLSFAQIESLRILHRVFTDASWQEIISRYRREKLRLLMRNVDSLSMENITAVLRWHGDLYKGVFPELTDSIEKTLKEIADYRQRRLLS